MSNTTVKIIYANGSTREFIASDELEKLINEGEMFSVTTMHSDMGAAEEMFVSKMYAGNPIAAMGHMMMMKRNAEKMLTEDDNKDMNIVIDTLTACISLMSDEITSHQSEMSPVMDNEKHDGDNKYQRAEKLIGELYMKCRDSQTINQHNPYTWAELNEDLMLRIQEFITATDETQYIYQCDHYHIDKNVCLHLFNLDNRCIGASKCEHRECTTNETGETITPAINTFKKGEPLVPIDVTTETEEREPCPVINNHCDHYMYKLDGNGKVAIEHCTHPSNPEETKYNCTKKLCPIKQGVVTPAEGTGSDDGCS